MKRSMALAIGLAGVVAVAAAGFFAGGRVQSPAEVASRRAAPEPSLITVPVERRLLSTEVVTRGTVQFGAARKVSLATSALKSGPGIVTSMAAAGAALAEGDVVMAVSGRPVFVLAGAHPAYRDLGPGSVGKDVLQLESALGRLGFDPGPIDEVYDEQTSAAVERWYVAAGYTPQGATVDQLAARRAADGESRQLANDTLDAESGLRTALQAVEAANAKMRLAELALDAARASDASAGISATSDELRAEAEVTRLEGQLRTAEAELRVARLRVSEAKSTVPLPTASELAGLEVAVETASAAVRATAGELAVARSSLAALSVGSKAPSASAAAIELEAARADLAAERNGLEIARRRVALAGSRSPLPEGLVRLGVQVPADELLFFPALPVRVDEFMVRPGDQALGTIMAVTNSQLTVVGSLPAAEARLVQSGATASIAATELGLTAAGTVLEIATTPGTRGADPQRFFLEVSGKDAPASLAGASVVVRIVVVSTSGEVLAVPVAAVSAAADGRSRIQVKTSAGLTVEVTVTVGLAAGGLVEVRPVDAELLAGDLVVVPNVNRRPQ